MSQGGFRRTVSKGTRGEPEYVETAGVNLTPGQRGLVSPTTMCKVRSEEEVKRLMDLIQQPEVFLNTLESVGTMEPVLYKEGKKSVMSEEMLRKGAAPNVA